MAAEPTETMKTATTPAPPTGKGALPPYNPELSYRAFPNWRESDDEVGTRKEPRGVAGVLHRLFTSWP